MRQRLLSANSILRRDRRTATLRLVMLHWQAHAWPVGGLGHPFKKNEFLLYGGALCVAGKPYETFSLIAAGAGMLQV
jgi:hypothetical protein